MRGNVRQVLRSRWFGILCAVVLVAVTALARWALTDVLRERAVFLIFLPAVALSAYLGGVWSGLVATLLGALGARLLMPGAPSSHALPLSVGEMLQLSLFLVAGTFISVLTEDLRRARAQSSRALNAVRRADERYRTFIRQSSEGIWRFELDQPVPVDLSEDAQVAAFFDRAYLAECNDAMARHYGYERAEQIVGARLHEMLVRDDPRNVEYLRKFVRGGYRLTDLESHERDRAGNPRVFLNNLVGTVEGGRVVRAWGTQRDVTEQVGQQERLRLYREVFANSNDGVAIIDAEGRYLEQNAAHRELTGFADADLDGKTPAVHLGQETFDRIAQELSVSGQWRGEAVSHTKRGHDVPVELSAFAVRDEAGNPRCFVGVKRDVTARKRAEDRLTAEHAVTRILAEARSLEEAAPAIVQAVRASLHARVGELWLPDEGAGVLRCAEVNCADADERSRTFGQRGRAFTFASGVGLPGRVWQSRTPAWVVDVQCDGNFPRAAIARAAGLHSGMAFPITSGEEFFGVMEFFTEAPLEPDPGLLSMMGAIGSEIGQFIRRRRAEEQLLRSQADLKDFVETATVGLHWVGPDGIILWANQAELDLLGYAREQYVGRHLAEFHTDKPVIDSILNCLTSGKTLRAYPARLRCADGSIRHVLIDSSARFEDGKFVHTRCFTRDVTNEKLAEAQLRASAESLRLALEAGRMGTWEWEIATGRVTWSPGLEAIHGLAPGTFGGTFDAFLGDVHPDDRARVQERVRQTLADRADHLIEYRLLLRGGSVRWVEGRGKLYCDESGQPQRMVGVCMDITARKRAEQERDELLARERQARAEAERANKAKDEFLAVLSHELRTPLTPVLLTTTLLEGAPGLPPELRDDLLTIRRNVELEARLIDDLLDLTRIARGKLQLDLQTTDLHSLIRSAADICHQGDELRLTLELQATRHHVRGDPARLQQVFWNLLSNAHKFTPTGGSITVRSRSTAPDERIRVEVIDTGVGIDPRALPRIFAAFEQGHEVGRRFGGLGLGLAITKALVDAQGGRITAHSDGPGRGATFVVELPTVRAPTPAPLGGTPAQPANDLNDSAANARARASASAATPTSTRALRILVVEDHEPTRCVMTKLLADLGHLPVSAGGIESALRAVESNPIDLVISDLGLPDGTGHELMRAIRRRFDIRGIALSGYGMEEDLRRSEEAGFAEHLIKPVDLGRLEAAIRRVTEHAAMA